LSFNVTEFGTNRKLICDFLLVVNTNFPPILHRFRDIAFDRSRIAIFGYPSCVYRRQRRGSVETVPKISTGRVKRTNVTNDRQTTDGRATAYAKREYESRFVKTKSFSILFESRALCGRMKILLMLNTCSPGALVAGYSQ